MFTKSQTDKSLEQDIAGRFGLPLESYRHIAKKCYETGKINVAKMRWDYNYDAVAKCNVKTNSVKKRLAIDEEEKDPDREAELRAAAQTEQPVGPGVLEEIIAQRKFEKLLPSVMKLIDELDLTIDE